MCLYFDNVHCLDLTTANTSADNVSVLLGDGSGGFGAATNLIAESDPLSLAAGDFDGDGVFDLAVANTDSSSVSVLLSRTP